MDKYRHWNKLPALGLSSKTKERLTKIMPGVHSNLHKHEWFKHGSCYGKNAEDYYKDTITLVEQFHHSKISNFFEKNIGKRVTLEQVRAKFDSSFGFGTGSRVELRCRNGLITELWLHLGSGSSELGTLLKNGKQARSRCKRGLIDKAGYGR
jgi:ribonuclease T2